ncbi:hypothetical protein LSUE1_G001586 [Lachnellula suecica]|uniref:Xylanolytic transcriptional activator regulatory domain-containing protein n=1 Tax=Lachnellula suecica TaxID=602035 RepID=A0A8T9CB28_9HELO|nr:hypothetical protein LSUE1_G001586 [Lachnellula suecica]
MLLVLKVLARGHRNFKPADFVSSKLLSCEYPVVQKRRRKKIHLSVESEYSSPRTSTAVAPSPCQVAVPEPTSEFPPVFYLDWNVFRSCQIDLPKAGLAVPPSITEFIEGPEKWGTIAAHYFSTVHTWMPIISKLRFNENILNPHANSIRSDYALLILCMDLITSPPVGQTPRSPGYVAAKQLYLGLEIQGVVSIQILQAGVLIALFELGHAIFPSASVSVGACVRYGNELGINWGANIAGEQPFSWADAEEQNRVWWAIVILDRFLQIGYPRHKELGSNQNGEQALLLDNAFRALEAVVESESQDDTLFVMNQTSICSIARVLLHEEHAAQRSSMASHFDEIHCAKQVTETVKKSSEDALSYIKLL